MKGEQMQSNVDIAWSYFDLMSQDRLDEAFDVLNPDGTIWELATRQTRTLRENSTMARELWKKVPMRFTLRNAYDAGPHAILEVESHATRADGGSYENMYCFVMEIRDGKIVDIHSYADARAAHEMFEAVGGWGGE
jgi:ketosteroid isomerase-like protein